MNVIKSFAAKNRQDAIRLKSSSGGIFFSIAESIINMNGVVYGVAMNDSCQEAKYIRCITIHEVEKILGSKYIQAKLGKTYCLIRDDLENGRKVLFSGTGCYINGLKTFLGKEYPNLLCVDVICHGVPSPLLWEKYVNAFENENHMKLRNVNFRCKNEGWRNFGMCGGDEKYTKIFIPKNKDAFLQLFLSDCCLRPSCYECYSKMNKMSDLTLGDFWGIEVIAPEFNDNKGVSLVIIRTEKGLQLFNDIVYGLDTLEVEYEDAVQHNYPEYKSVPRPSRRDTFFADLANKPFNKVKQKYVKDPLKIRLKICIKKMISIPKFIWGGTAINSNLNYGVMYYFK